MRASGLLLAAVCLLTGQAHAAESGGSLSDRYQRSLKELEVNRNTEMLTRAKRERIAEDARNLQSRLVANVAKIREIEAAYATTEREIGTLNQTLRGLEDQLEKDRDKVAHLLAVLQRMDNDTPPALAIHPDDSLSAARSAMQLGRVLPPVYEEAAALAKRLKTLQDTKAAVAAKATEGQAQTEALKRAQVDLDQLLQLRHQEGAEVGVKLTELHGITQEIAKTTSNLKLLIDRIAVLRAVPGSRQGMTVVTARGDGGILSKNSLRLPVLGKIMAGDPAGPGKTPGSGGPQGLWFETVGGTEAVAPGDSEVVFAGPYQKFGQVLILEIVGGYHLTLAGLGRIDVQIGDSVLAGEPVGSLPQGSPARLYLELRRKGQTVDPAPWMGAELRKAKGT